GGAEDVAVVVEVHAPRVAGAVREHFELLLLRVIPPDARVDGNALFVGRARLAAARVREHAVAAVQPAVRPPDARVERLVRVVVTPAVEDDLGRAVGLAVAVAVRDGGQIGGPGAPTPGAEDPL